MKLKRFLFKKVKSTNKTAIRLIKCGNDNGIISAEIQTKGKGQKSFLEMDSIKKKKVLENEKNNDLYKKFKSTFSDAELIEVIKKE